MYLRETEKSTEQIMGRMENSLNSLEQMSLDSINITDRLVTEIDEIRKCTEEMKNCSLKDREMIIELIDKLLQNLLDTAFIVNNVSHELEREAAYQRETVDSIRQIVDFLYGMTESH